MARTTPIITITAVTSATGRRRYARVAITIVAAALVAVSTIYIVGISRLVRAGVNGDGNLLDAGATATGRPDRAREAMIGSALAANTLSQSILNALLVERARAAARPMSKADADMLLRLGWRDDVALRNVAEVYADGSNLPKLLNVFDALLRRSSKVGEPVTAILGYMETTPTFQAALVTKLAQDPPWRSMYFRLGASQITSREAAFRRLKTYQALARTGKPPVEAETAAMLPVLHAQGLGAEAFELWQDTRRHARRPLFARPLNDPSFTRAAALQENEGVATVYDWTVAYGDGFGVTFGSDPADLKIEWDGRGVPVFLRQRTSASPGTYRLTVAAGAEEVENDALGFRLVCPQAAVELSRVAARGGTILYRTDGPVTCAFPMFEIFGRVQNRYHQISLALKQVALSPDRS